MSRSRALARALPDRNAHFHAARIAGAGASMVPFVDRLPGRSATRNSLLDCYLEGWAEADAAKIAAATAPGYCFLDSLVGSFSWRSLREYFELLQDRLSCAGTITRTDVHFFMHGPMEERTSPGELRFWREAPRVGLTGVTRIEVGERGIIAESVAYDLNLASNLLRHFPK